MFYKKFDSKYVIRLEKGEEIVASLKKFCTENGIKAGSVQGIGASNNLSIGFFKTAEKKFYPREFKGDYEITSLMGNISTFNGEPVLHLHINIADSDHHVHGGHLNSAVISVTFEIILDSINTEIKRAPNQETGLNLMDLE